MADAQSNESPLDRVAEGVEGVSSDAFELLGNETRLAILLALWDAYDPTQPLSEIQSSALSFSELRDRVGMRDSGQFNYHLSKLEGLFVDQTDEGYTSTKAARQITHAILAGTVTEEPSFEGEPIDMECPFCGGANVIDYRDRFLTRRCTNCEGISDSETYPSGTLTHTYHPPAGLQNRTPQEFFRQCGNWASHQMSAKIEGTCLECSGNVSPSTYICPDHDTEGEGICEQCNRSYRIEWVFACEVCKDTHRMPGHIPIIVETAVVTFFYEHGIDLLDVDETTWETVTPAIEQTEVRSEEPLEITVTVEIDDDRLVVTLDEDANVIDATEEVA